MFDKIGLAAEKAATNVARREFLGRLGRGAAVVAGALGGFLLTARDAAASDGWCCLYFDGTPTGGGAYRCYKTRCPKRQGGDGGSGYGRTVRCSDFSESPYNCPQ